MDKKDFHKLDPAELEGVSGGAWTGEETELSMVCAGCRCVQVFKKDEWGVWRCTVCTGKETMRWQDL